MSEWMQIDMSLGSRLCLLGVGAKSGVKIVSSYPKRIFALQQT